MIEDSAISTQATRAVATELQGPLREVKQALERLYGDRLVRVVLFGSHARGEARSASDVDVLVVLHGPVDPFAEAYCLGAIMLDASLQHGLALSLLPIAETRYEDPTHPLSANAREEGIEL